VGKPLSPILRLWSATPGRDAPLLRKSVYMPYLIAELVAKKNKAGLWAAPDMPHPNLILFGALKGEK
jgi:hypothetical protein